MKRFVILFLFLVCSLFAQNSFFMRKVSPSDIFYQPTKDEGYFQGWNFLFTNSEYLIFVTGLVSNLGPNDLNNGVSISIESKKTGSYFLTNEYGEKHLTASTKDLNIKLYESTIKVLSGNYEVNIVTDKLKLYLKYTNPLVGPTISGEKYFIKKDRFVRADIPFSYSQAEGYLEFQGEKISLVGLGGMEHLLTNYEVYKFSKRWELIRSIAPNGHRLFTGGFIAKEGKSFRTFAVQDKKGSILISALIDKTEAIVEKKDNFSGYILPIKEKIFISGEENCFFTVEYLESAGKIRVLDNISRILSFFVKLFFADPYIVNHRVHIESSCQKYFPTKMIWNGVKSDYLINTK